MSDGDRTPTVGNAEVRLCGSDALQESGIGLRFEVVAGGNRCPAFAIRHGGQVHAYLNRCAHVAMEMDFQPNQFFDSSGNWLVCATHGALYQPQTGQCRGGPCRGGLIKITLSEQDGVVHWHTAFNLQPLEF